MRSTGAMCGTSMEPLAHPFLCSRAQMPWRHDVTAETWQATVLYSGLSAHLKQNVHLESFGGSLTSVAEASQGTSRCTWTW